MRYISSVVFVLAWLITIGCASTPNRQAVGTKYISDTPPLEVEFAYKIGDVENKKDSKFLTLYTTEVRNVWIELHRIKSNTYRTGNFPSLQEIAKNDKFQYFGPVYFGDHQWVKVANITKDDWLVCGYMTRKDNWMVFIHNSYELDSDGIKRYREYQKTFSLNDADRQFIENLFVDLNKAINFIR